MTTTQTPHQVAHSVEPTRVTYLIRRSIVGGLLLIIVLAAVAAGARLVLPDAGTIDPDEALARVAAPAEQASAVEETVPPPTTPATAVPVEASPTPAPAVVPEPAELTEPAVPPRASRLVIQPPERSLDTRGDSAAASGTDGSYRIGVPQNRTAIALSVSLVGSVQAGVVTIDGGAGTVAAIEVAKGGVSATNLVVVPVIATELTVRNSAGGEVIIDTVGTFEPSTETSGGRFVALDPTRIATLETAIDGREINLPFGDVTDEAAAVLVVISADVGADGGMVRLGPEVSDVNQMLMWGPAVDGNPQRRGLALIEPSAAGSGYLRYDGGTLLTVDVVGYFTTDGAARSVSGLYVPAGPRALYSGSLDPAAPVEVDGVQPQDGTAFVTINASDGPGQAGAFLAPVSGGTITVATDVSREADVTLLGVFLE